MRRSFFRTIVFLSSLALVVSCAKKKEDKEATATPGAPTAGTAIAFSAVSTSGMTLTWGAATDVETAQADLQYKLVSSTSNNIATAEDAEANGTLVMDWTANTLTSPVTGLTDETNYYFTVLIKDADNMVAFQTDSRATLCDGKMIYLATVSMGNFGGKAGADTACNAQKPSGFSGTAKALVYDSAGGRLACSGADCTSSNTGQADWPVAANTSYCNTNYAATMGSSNNFGFLNVTLANSLSDSRTYTYTGLTGAFAGSDNCTDWTVWANPNVANAGSAHLTGVNFHSSSIGIFCATGGSVYCIEQ